MERWDRRRNVAGVAGAPFLARSLREKWGFPSPREKWGFPSPELILSVIPNRAESPVRKLLFGSSGLRQLSLIYSFRIFPGGCGENFQDIAGAARRVYFVRGHHILRCPNA